MSLKPADTGNKRWIEATTVIAAWRKKERTRPYKPVVPGLDQF